MKMPPQKRKGGHAEAKGQHPSKKKAMMPSGSKAENAQLLTVDYEMLAAAIIRQQDQTRAQSPEVATAEQVEADNEITHTSVYPTLLTVLLTQTSERVQHSTKAPMRTRGGGVKSEMCPPYP